MNLVEYIGYSALGVSLLSLNMTNMFKFRFLHLIACVIYLVYGILIDAKPLAVGAILFSLIHCFRLYKMIKSA